MGGLGYGFKNDQGWPKGWAMRVAARLQIVKYARLQCLSREEGVRIAVMGSGGVGGFFGAKLARGGADVSFIARGAHLAAMREHGLAIESTDESFSLPKVKVTDDPATIGQVDLVMFGVKLWDTEQAARLLLPIMGRETTLISFQNGVQ